jgi:filamentous hemagglutinin family protein
MLKNMHMAVAAFLSVATVNAGTAYLGNNAILSQATRATVAADGGSHAIATAHGGAASAVLDWTKFNVGSGQSMTFDGSGTTFFNLVDRSAGTSEINGLIKGSAGSVWVINPAGIAFGASAQVNLDGLFAAAAGNISNAEALRNGTAMLPEFSSLS